MMNRRQFINQSAALFVTGCVCGEQLSASTADKTKKRDIGIQLYSVRNELPNDFEGCLRKISEMGYKAVEPYFFGSDKIFGYTIQELNALVKRLGMTLSGTLVLGPSLSKDNSNASILDYWKKCAADVKSVGGQWVIQVALPGASNTIDDLKRIADYLNRAGEQCRKVGVRFAYHNHYHELHKVDGEVILDFLLKNTNPKWVSYQLDLGHVVNGGGDCVQYLRDFPRRFPLWHVSDFDVINRKSADIGKGDVPYPALFNLAKSSGLEQLIVELHTEEDCFTKSEAALEYIKKFN